MDNRKVYAYLINENLIYKGCPVILANSIELQGMTVKNADEAAALHKIKQNDEVKEYLPKINPQKKGRQYDMKALCLIFGYLMRIDEMTETLQPALEEILSKAPYHVELMIQMAIVLAMEFKMKRSPKRVTARNILTLLEFSQNITQALWKDDNLFLQLPHINEQKTKQLKRNYKKPLTIE